MLFLGKFTVPDVFIALSMLTIYSPAAYELGSYDANVIGIRTTPIGIVFD